MSTQAIIDVGTNTCILLIAQIDNQQFKILHEQMELVRLGQGLIQTQSFHPDAIERALTTFKNFEQIIQKHNCDAIHYIGTEACRVAKNFSNFNQELQKQIGRQIHRISGDDEAELIFKATAHDFKHIPKPWLILDIGGGSTEFILAEQNKQAQSMPFGSVKLFEKFIHSDPPKPNEIKDLKEFVKSQIQNHDFLNNTSEFTLIATAGTPTTLLALHQNMTDYQASEIHGKQMTTQNLNSQCERLSQINFEQRSKIPLLPPKRADVILAGMSILQAVCEHFNLNKFYVSDRGLRYGKLYELLD